MVCADLHSISTTSPQPSRVRLGAGLSLPMQKKNVLSRAKIPNLFEDFEPVEVSAPHLLPTPATFKGAWGIKLCGVGRAQRDGRDSGALVCVHVLIQSPVPICRTTAMTWSAGFAPWCASHAHPPPPKNARSHTRARAREQ